jgi:cell division protein FtsB
MKKLDSKSNKETSEKEIKRLQKENAKLKSKEKAYKAKMKEMSKELKKKDAPTVTLTEKQKELLSILFPDINSLF